MEFDTYWAGIDDELGQLPARPVLEPVPSRTTDEAAFYTVRLTSVGPYRIFGYLSIPGGPGPFPALLATPRHGSVNHVPHPNDRSRYVVFAVMHRGQRLADEGLVAPYPGLLTLGIADPGEYIYRGIVADCLRAAEFLLGLAEVDPDRVAVSGDDLALLIAARRPGFSTVRLADLLFYRAMEARLLSGLYPIEELNDHLRTGADERSVADTLSYFDPLRHAAAVTARTLVSTDNLDWCAPLVDTLPDAETYRITHQDGTDNDAVDAWLAGRLGVTPLSRYLRPVG